MHGNTVFIDLQKGAPFPDQWKFLKDVKKHTVVELDAVYYKLFNRTSKVPETTSQQDSRSNIIYITVNNKLPQTIQLIPVLWDPKDQLNFINTEYIVKTTW